MAQSQTPNPVELFEKASGQAKSIIAGVKQEQLVNPTPCSEWTVRDLISHIIGGAENAKAALTGNPDQMEFGASKSTYSTESDVSKLAAAYTVRVSETLQAASVPGALENKIPGPVGEMSSGEFLAAIFMDNLIHTWDLAKATGQETNLDHQLVEMCYAMSVPGMADLGRQFGVVGPVVEVPDSASIQDKLISYFGRHP